MRDFITPIGGFLVIGCVVSGCVAVLYLASRISFWRNRADYWFTRAMLAEGEGLAALMRRSAR